MYGDSFYQSVFRGVLFGRKSSGAVPNAGIGVLDIRTGEWRELSATWPCGIVVHPLRPLVIMLEGANPRKVQRIAVFNWQTGAEIFAHSMRREEGLSDWPFFLSDRDQIVLPLMNSLPAEGGDLKENIRSLGWLEAWTLANPPTLDQVVQGVEGHHSYRHSPAVTSNGRLLFDAAVREPEGGDKVWMDVYDLNERRFLSTKPPGAPAVRTFCYGRVPPTIAPNGRAVLRYEKDNRAIGRGWADHGSVLIEVGSGRLLWRTGWADTVEEVPWVSFPQVFKVSEEWHRYWENWLPESRYRTLAWRNLNDGRLLMRTSANMAIDHRQTNVTKTLFVTDEGTVHRLPLDPNYRLLALCQAILALPLVLLWVMLR
jgi:hypothetical protein